MASNRVYWYKWKDKRCSLDIPLELGVIAIYLGLTKLQAACATEHDIDDAEISDAGDNPLPQIAACSEAHDE